ncbi:MAG: hypothetical protein FWF05_08305 [Oscillospiraceae bacterium]|nr:hypothetical protein [Oscillospiraceae bacterium]
MKLESARKIEKAAKKYLGSFGTDLLTASHRAGGTSKLKNDPARALPMGTYDKIDAPAADCFTVGFAKTHVMPQSLRKKKYYIAGYKAYNPATGMLDPMMASAVWIDDNSGRGGVVFVSVDCIGLLSPDVRAIKALLRDFRTETGCRSINIMSTHDHASIDTMGYWGPLPKTGRDEAYMKTLHEGVKQAVIRAYEDRRDGSLFHGRKETPDIQRDSRDPQVFSKFLTRLRFVPKDGSREIYMLNYDSHSESLLGNNSLVSADFPGYVRREIMQACGAETIYFVGAVGGLIRLKELDPDPIQSTLIAGRVIAETAMSIEDERELRPTLNLLKQKFYIPAENLLMLSAVKIGIMRATKHAVEGAPLGWALRTEMTYFNIDGLQMLLIPGEIFPEVVYGGYLSAEESATGEGPEFNPKPLSEIAGDDRLLVFGLANDEIGYMVPPNDFILHPVTPYIDGGKDRFGKNHYEETNSLGPQVVPVIAKVFQSMMNIVKRT